MNFFGFLFFHLLWKSFIISEIYWFFMKIHHSLLSQYDGFVFIFEIIHDFRQSLFSSHSCQLHNCSWKKIWTSSFSSLHVSNFFAKNLIQQPSTWIFTYFYRHILLEEPFSIILSILLHKFIRYFRLLLNPINYLHNSIFSEFWLFAIL